MPTLTTHADCTPKYQLSALQAMSTAATGDVTAHHVNFLDSLNLFLDMLDVTKASDIAHQSSLVQSASREVYGDDPNVRVEIDEFSHEQYMAHMNDIFEEIGPDPDLGAELESYLQIKEFMENDCAETNHTESESSSTEGADSDKEKEPDTR